MEPQGRRVKYGHGSEWGFQLDSEDTGLSQQTTTEWLMSRVPLGL